SSNVNFCLIFTTLKVYDAKIIKILIGWRFLCNYFGIYATPPLGYDPQSPIEEGAVDYFAPLAMT
ncbi:MAG: hypothetical protein LBT04_06190, partial [Prevotellaceae bacterium]|nr:hypothetical protein [Prevotellaceae bacterium]